MELLKQKIKLEGQVLNNSLLKVDSFLNQQIDAELMVKIGEEFARRFADETITKILTIESSGIAAALTTAIVLKVPVVFARKRKTAVESSDLYSTNVYSFTKKETCEVTVSKRFLAESDRVLIIDDFLANGEAALGLAKLVLAAGGKTVGVGIVIEKSFQPGAEKIAAAGYRLESLARIKSFTNGQVDFL